MYFNILHLLKGLVAIVTVQWKRKNAWLTPKKHIPQSMLAEKSNWFLGGSICVFSSAELSPSAS